LIAIEEKGGYEILRFKDGKALTKLWMKSVASASPLLIFLTKIFWCKSIFFIVYHPNVVSDYKLIDKTKPI
jgi:hypothetical protein